MQKWVTRDEVKQILALDSVHDRRNITLNLCGQDFETKRSSVEEELELRAQVAIREVALRTGDLPGLLCDLELLGIKRTGAGTGRIELSLIHEMVALDEVIEEAEGPELIVGTTNMPVDAAVPAPTELTART